MRGRAFGLVPFFFICGTVVGGVIRHIPKESSFAVTERGASTRDRRNIVADTVRNVYHRSSVIIDQSRSLYREPKITILPRVNSETMPRNVGEAGNSWHHEFPAY